jgi:hypothetical protein
VIDPKGENAAITARYQRQMGRKVLILDPWNMVQMRERMQRIIRSTCSYPNAWTIWWMMPA